MSSFVRRACDCRRDRRARRGQRRRATACRLGCRRCRRSTCRPAMCRSPDRSLQDILGAARRAARRSPDAQYGLRPAAALAEARPGDPARASAHAASRADPRQSARARERRIGPAGSARRAGRDRSRPSFAAAGRRAQASESIGHAPSRRLACAPSRSRFRAGMSARDALQAAAHRSRRRFRPISTMSTSPPEAPCSLSPERSPPRKRAVAACASASSTAASHRTRRWAERASSRTALPAIPQPTGHGTAVASLIVGNQGPFRGAAQRRVPVRRRCLWRHARRRIGERDRPRARLARWPSARRSSTSAWSGRRTGLSQRAVQHGSCARDQHCRGGRQRRPRRAAAISRFLSRRRRGHRRRRARAGAAGGRQGRPISILRRPAPTWPRRFPARAMRGCAAPASPRRSPRPAWRSRLVAAPCRRSPPGQGPRRPRHRLRRPAASNRECPREINSFCGMKPRQRVVLLLRARQRPRKFKGDTP